MSASDFLRRHGWQMRANHWEHPKFPDVLHHVEQALLQTGMWLEQERVSPEERAALDAMRTDPEQFCADAAWWCEELARKAKP